MEEGEELGKTGEEGENGKRGNGARRRKQLSAWRRSLNPIALEG
jgi:hypothetical protein